MQKIDQFPLLEVQESARHYNKAFHAKLFTLFASSESEIVQLKKDFPLGYDYCFCFINDDQGQWYLSAKSVEQVRKYILVQAEQNAENIFLYYNKWLVDWEKYIVLNQELKDSDFTQLNTEEFYKVFSGYYNLYLRVGGVAYICDSFMSSGETDWLEDYLVTDLNKYYQTSEIYNVIASLTSPIHLSFVLEEELDLLKMAVGFKDFLSEFPRFDDLDMNHQKLLREHSDKYYWMKNNYYNVEYYGVDQVYKGVKELIQNHDDVEVALQKKVEELKNNKMRREEIINEAKLSVEKKNVVRVANLFSKWKDTRKSGVYIGMWMFDRFLAEVARRTGYTKQELTFVVFSEVQGILFDKCNLKTEIKKRQEKLFYAVLGNGEYIMKSGKESEEYFDSLSDVSLSDDIMKGVCACPGLASGEVRIIRKTEEMAEFKEGEILVTNNTTPEFLPIMKKAVAIITEQGGITSHAAIISRELKKPCIIGIKGIVNKLANGDRVEVDANHGVITVFNKKFL